ncbi:MAG: hypothetical protein AB7V04_10230 [Desulfomonilaceae bacterium]
MSELLRGNSASVVSARNGIARSSLYKFPKRAIAATIHDVIKDQTCGPKLSEKKTATLSALVGYWAIRMATS